MESHATWKIVASGLSIGTSSRQFLSLMSEAAAISKRHQPRCLCRRAFVYAAPVGSSPVRQSVNILGWIYHLRVEHRHVEQAEVILDERGGPSPAACAGAHWCTRRRWAARPSGKA